MADGIVAGILGTDKDSIGRDDTEEKRAEERYRRLFARSPLPYVSIAPNGKVLAVNQTCLDTFDYTKDEVLGTPLKAFFTPSSHELFVRELPRFVQSGKMSGKAYEVIAQDGSIILVQAVGFIIRNDFQEPVSIHYILHDVTRQRQREVQRREREEWYRLFFEHAPVGVLYYDQDLYITDCNTRYAEIIGGTRQQLLGLNTKELNDRAIVSLLQEALTGEEGRWEGVYRTTLRERSIFVSMRMVPLYNRENDIQGGMLLVEDFTRQSKMEEEKVRFMSAIEQASEVIVITDTKSEIEYVNPAFEMQTGYSFAEVRGRNPRILQSGKHDRSFYKEMWRTLVRGRVWRGHMINKRKDGTLFEEDVTISPVRNREGIMTNFVAVKRDVSREINLKRQLNRAMKMEAIGTLAGGIAHDFNNILSAVLGYAEVVDMQIADDDPVKQDVAQIISAGNRAADLVKQILTFSRQEEEDLRPVKLQFIVKEVLKLLRSSLPSTIELEQSIAIDCGSVLADPTRIHQVLMNLCTNAKQAMGAAGGILKVTLGELRVDSDSPIPLHPAITVGRWIDLEVSDTGPGIEEVIRERIFDPFFTTKEKGQGTGLGLSVVHGIVKSHGGEIAVFSRPGQGSTFHVYLPLIATEQKHAPEKPQIVLPGGTERILLVDDEELLVEVMERLLDDLGYTVTSTTDSGEALLQFQEQPDEVDLIITDMTMPHCTGVELAEAALAIRPDIPIILCSGYSEYIGQKEAKVKGIRQFLAKPVDKKTLAQCVRQILDER